MREIVCEGFMQKLIVAAALFLTGCIPEVSFWWSPDGQTAAIRTAECLRRSDARGKLSAIVLPGDVQSAAWVPDGSALIVSLSIVANTWPEVEAMIPWDEAKTTGA